MKSLLLTSAALAMMLTIHNAQAVPIAAGSELSINGSDTFTATSITFSPSGNVGGTSGSFTILANCNNCVTMTSTVFTSAFAGVLYNVVDGADTSSLTISPPSTFTFTGGALPSLNVSGAGTLTLTGFDPTPGIYDLTTQGPTTANVTFSATSVGTAVSEPGTLGLLGAALAWLGFIGWRRRSGGLVGQPA